MGGVPEPHSFYRGIRAVPSGHSLWIGEQGVGHTQPYASVVEVWRSASAEIPGPLDGTEFTERIGHALRESVAAHRVSDVPVGAFLSAGIDSGALVGLMAESGGGPIQAVTLGFGSFRRSGADGVPLAEQVALRYGVRGSTVWVSDREAAEVLPKMLADMDQPSVDGFNTWLVSKYAAEGGLKVVVSGIRGGELFGGYSHFERLPRWRSRLDRMALIPGLLAAATAAARAGRFLGLVHPKAEGLPRYGADMEGLYLVGRGLFMSWELVRLVGDDVLREGLRVLRPPEFIRRALAGNRFGNDHASIAALEAAFYLRNQLFRDSDWASMAHSLELRTPLVDFHLLRELAALIVRRPPGKSGKLPLAQAPKPALPEAVVHRPKSGFSLPMERWVEQSEPLWHWRAHANLQRDGVSWARRLAFALLAQAFPDVVVRGQCSA
ncbi:asparagine synthetase B family protein [Thioflavicoccus mobilis]|uniref:asparagine synthetase B family protein n=1 Tax=Thioflavicoccus mobilis TaxID=80679 RepID=UPI0006860A4B|nr:asparagine synthase C-terminal domain-containing protein [Thioflavicoccus mobilis]